MLTIYGCYRSRATRPLWLLHETGTPFRHVPVIQAYRLPNAAASDAPVNTASEAFLAINPQGQIPVMDDDGFLLTESMAITLYLARRYGGDLGARDGMEDSLSLQWALFAATSIEAPALVISYAYAQNRAATPEGQAEIEKAMKDLRRPFARLESYLASRDWLIGNRFTATDICVAECVRYASAHAALMAEFPKVSDWLARCQARPAFKAMWEARLAEPA